MENVPVKLAETMVPFERVAEMCWPCCPIIRLVDDVALIHRM
jgi:hypothetical protein